MKKQAKGDPLVIARRIRDAGRPIYIPEDDGGARGIASNDLRVYQTGGTIESTAFDFGPGTGFKILLVITNNRPTFAISRFDLDLPWKQSHLHWLEDPLVIDGPSRCYRFGGSEVQEFERNQVINHRADVTRTLSRGESIEGFLLAIGYDSIPSQFQQGSMIPAFVVIYDQFGRDYRAPVKLWTDRSSKTRPRKPFGVPRRGRLLDKRDVPVRD